jgi:hypothetical protein
MDLAIRISRQQKSELAACRPIVTKRPHVTACEPVKVYMQSVRAVQQGAGWTRPRIDSQHTESGESGEQRETFEYPNSHLS